MKAQVDLVHGMLGEIHQWYLNNLKNVPTMPGRSKAANSGSAVYCASSKQVRSELELTFSVNLDISNHLLCVKTAFHPELLRTQGTRIFRCLCGNHDNLEYTFRCLITSWKIKNRHGELTPNSASSEPPCSTHE
jgi:hypothetical protein